MKVLLYSGQILTMIFHINWETSHFCSDFALSVNYEEFYEIGPRVHLSRWKEVQNRVGPSGISRIV